MSSERESLLPAHSPNDNNLPAVALTHNDYDIMGNVFRAYYDNAQHMVFVVDSTQNSRKPNVLLVLPQSGERKWDDILTNDWGVDLETIRPRKDNKYQKLDIEYGNVDAYIRLVHDFQAGADLQNAISELNAFRDDAVRRNARIRLDAAQDVVENARETIEKTNISIKELNARMKDLRAKLATQKKSIGKEPTKQSAAKILRSDSMIDATGEKIERARRRLANARRRLLVAEDDIVAAQNILDLLDTDSNSDTKTHSVMIAPRMDMVASMNKNVPEIPQFKEITTEEPKAEEMAEEEVKPLFDKDPEILDEEIAFKPIDFGVSTASSSTVADVDVTVTSETPVAPAPLSFTPPPSSGSEYTEPAVSGGSFAPIPDVPEVSSSPVLDSMRPVDIAPQQPTVPEYDVRPTAATDERAFAYAAAEAPVVQNPSYDNLGTNNVTQPSSVPEYNNSLNTAAAPAPNMRPSSPMPGVADASAASGFRPVSPIRGATVAPTGSGQRKPKLMYYIMLVMLIALSIFTLWIYQRSTSQNIPELTTTAKGTEETTVAKNDATTAPSPFIDATVPQPAPEPVAEPVAEPVVVPVEEPEPVIAEPVEVPAIEKPEPIVVEPEPVVVEPAPVTVEPEPVNDTETASDVTITTVEAQSPFLTKPVEKPKFEPITIEPIVNKPVYNVSQQEKMFVADAEYETDAPVVNNQNVAYADDIASSDDVVCSDGAYPDANGCCGGEVFTDMENGTFACCQPVEGGECFAPLR